MNRLSILNESYGQDGLQHFVTGALQKESHQYFHPAGVPEMPIDCVIRRLWYRGAPDALKMNIANASNIRVSPTPPKRIRENRVQLIL